jgi:hypothetical protein
MLRDKTCMTALVNERRSIVAPAIVQHPLHIPSESMDRAVAQVLAMVHAETAEAVQHEKRKPEDAKTEERNVQPRIATSPSPPLTQRPSPPSDGAISHAVRNSRRAAARSPSPAA